MGSRAHGTETRVPSYPLTCWATWRQITSVPRPSWVHLYSPVISKAPEAGRFPEPHPHRGEGEFWDWRKAASLVRSLMGFIHSVPHLSKGLIYSEVSVSQPVNLTPRPPSQENDGTCQGGHASAPSGNQAL